MMDVCWLKIYFFLFSYHLQLHMVCIVQRLPAAICLRLNTDCEWLVSAHIGIMPIIYRRLVGIYFGIKHLLVN